MATAATSLTVEQQQFSALHAVDVVGVSFAAGSVFMYHDAGAFTDRWHVRPDGSTIEHDRFEHAQPYPYRRIHDT